MPVTSMTLYFQVGNPEPKKPLFATDFRLFFVLGVQKLMGMLFNTHQKENVAVTLR